jgi:hypothetical protein
MKNLARPTKRLVEDYFYLIQNLTDEDKLELIARISNSILHKKQQGGEQTKEEILKETYGCFISLKSADELIDEIYSSRHFTDKGEKKGPVKKPVYCGRDD